MKREDAIAQCSNNHKTPGNSATAFSGYYYFNERENLSSPFVAIGFNLTPKTFIYTRTFSHDERIPCQVLRVNGF